MGLAIEHIGQYTRPETYVQETAQCHISLCLSGLDYMRFSVPGRGAELELPVAKLPCFLLLPPGIRIDFRFNRHRDNWVIQCRLPELELEEEPGQLQARYRCGELFLSTPLFRPVEPELAQGFQERFRRSAELWRSGLPADRLAATLLASGILGEIIAPRHRENDGPLTPAERLRERIDADSRFSKTLASLSCEAEFGAGYLRKCFCEAYKVEPSEYRARRRLSRILELLDSGEYSFKEIAEEVGMRHVTHLNAFLRERCNATPGELRKSRRGV